MKKLVVASGKGGVGKSMLSSSLAILFAQSKKIVAADCDVDAPNLNIWLGGGQWQESRPISVSKVPVIDRKKCDGCGICEKKCQFSAIKVRNGKAEVNPFLCEGCGVCQVVCPKNAITMEPAKSGFINQRQTKYGFRIISGSLSPGQSGSGKIVTEVKKRTEKEQVDMMVVDSAPGTGCPVIASLQGADLVCLITEPTPAGQADLKRVFKVIRDFQLSYRVVINKADLNPKITRAIEEEFGKKVIGRINYDRKIFQALAKLEPVVETNLEARKEIENIYSRLQKLLI